MSGFDSRIEKRSAFRRKKVKEEEGEAGGRE